MKLTIIIPVYNEARTLLSVVKRVAEQPLPPGLEKEIILVDDGSSDGSPEVVRQCEERFGAKALISDINLGKGASVRRGYAHATGDIVLVQDADLELDPAEYPRLVQPILDGETDVVYGSRFLSGRRKGAFLSRTANRLLTLLTNVLYRSKLTDMETGYKVLRRQVADGLSLKSSRFEFEPEVTAKLLRLGYQIKEVPVSYNPRTAEMGKSIGLWDGLQAILTLMRHRLEAESRSGHVCEGAHLRQPGRLARVCGFLWRIRWPVGIFLLTLGLYHVNLTSEVVGDAVPAPYVAWSLVHEGDFDLDEFLSSEEELRDPKPHRRRDSDSLNWMRGLWVQYKRGRWVNKSPPGSSLMCVPHALIFSAFFNRVPDKEAMNHLGKFSAATCCALAVAIYWVIAMRLFPESANLSTWLFGFGTTLYSVAGQSSWQHGPATFWLCLALFALLVSRVKSPFRRGALAGFSLGMAIVCRPPLALLCACLGGWLLLRKEWRVAAGMVAGTILPGLFLMWYHCCPVVGLLRVCN